MINETIGRSIITVLQSKNDVINFALLYVPLGRMFLDIIQGAVFQYYHSFLMLVKGISYKAIAFGVFQQSLLFPNERINISHGRFDIFMGVFKEELTA